MKLHDWEAGSAWGVILGVSRCILCGLIATAKRLGTECPGRLPNGCMWDEMPEVTGRDREDAEREK